MSFKLKNLLSIIKTLTICSLMFLMSGINVFAFDNNINIYSDSDINNRYQIEVQNTKNTNFINFYSDKYWWNTLSSDNKSKILNFITNLASEFEYSIYPKTTKVFPNISNWLNYQKKLIVILSPMDNGVQGYIRRDDFKSKTQSQTSNNDNIIYLNSDNILNPSISDNILFSFFSHEFMHLITYQEKNLKYNTEEDTWLEELRSEYLPHYLGYNKTQNSYLNFRLQNGISLTDINLTDWINSNNTYALINLFSIYLAQKYSSDIIFSTLSNNLSGVASINYFLSSKGYKDRFSDIYQNWIITNILNNCDLNPNYCYKDIDIQINIPGTSFFLPINNDSVLSISDLLGNYQSKYQKIIGGSDNLQINLENTKNNTFQKIPYILIDRNNQKTLGFFEFKNETIKQINIPNYSQTYSNIIIIPMFASNDNINSQIFKWNINSTKLSSSVIKPVFHTTTTKNEKISTTAPSNSKPESNNSTPIIINIIKESTPWYIQITNSLKGFFTRIWSIF